MRNELITLRVKPKAGSGQPIDPEYVQKWDNLVAKFKRNGKFVPKKKTIKVRARVKQITGPVWKGKRPYQAVDPNALEYKRYFTLDIFLVEEGVEGLRFLVDVTASLDPRAKFSALYYAVTGEAPDEEDEEFALSPGSVTTRDFNAVISFGGERPTKAGKKDTRRGGIYTDIVGYEEIALDEDADEEAEDAWVTVPNEGIEAKEQYEAQQQALAVGHAKEAAAEEDAAEDTDGEPNF